MQEIQDRLRGLERDAGNLPDCDWLSELTVMHLQAISTAVRSSNRQQLLLLPAHLKPPNRIMHQRKLPFLLSTLLLAPLAGNAAVSTVSPWHTAGNGSSTDYGIGWFQVPNLALYHRTKNSFGSGSFTGQMQIWALGFSDLQGISYSSDIVANLSILPVSGWEGGVSFFGFDLGAFDGGNTPQNVGYEVWNGDFSSLIASGSVMVGAVHETIDFSLYSPNGFHLQFDSKNSAVGLDDYRVEGGNSAIPEPSTAVLSFVFAAGLFLRRRP